MPTFEKPEYQSRLHKTKESMAARGIKFCWPPIQLICVTSAGTNLLCNALLLNYLLHVVDIGPTHSPT